ncbi:MAG: glycosyltransferase family 39 protein [Selenomonas sp.]|uniref:ArnT family glycosyltransferase n=1 Tax=Selenomonas sp. TaxID=2053611 RepID=UPI0025F2FFEE|nr:glycosyltransferase family 39 protein [Selenomonas sp.]MCR5758703.1 glycosyltransferase family 39 protein [Selenomonas sp.]
MINEKKHWAVLGGLWLVLYLLGNHLLTVTDPVECNYAETAREMLVYNDYFSPRIFGNFWFDKPIFFYWELAAAFHVFGFTNFAARLAPSLTVLASMGLLYWWGKRLYGSRVAFVAALLFTTSLETWYVGHAIVTDMTLLFTVSLTLIAFYCGYQQRCYNWYYLAMASAAVAVLDKGPIGLCLPGLIILLFLLWQRDIRALLVKQLVGGFVVFCLVAGIWYVPMYMKHGQEFIDVFLGVHNVMRATVSEHPRDNVWYYYFGIFLAGFFPWVFVAIPAFIKKWRSGWRLRLNTDTRFLLVWAVTVFVVFQCFATKYVTYTFPYMFPVVLLMARYFCNWGRKLFYGTAVMTVIYVGLVFGVAAPKMEHHSAYGLAQAAQPYLNQGAEVYCYGRREGVVSFTYFTGHYLHDLVSQEELEKSHKLDWSVTNIIPKASLESIETDKPLLIIGGAESVENLQKKMPGNWRLLEKGRRNNLYYREAD